MVFVDCRLIERKGGKVFKKKVLAIPEHLLGTIVKKSIDAFLGKDDRTILDDCVDGAMKRIQSISCNDSDITEYVDEPIRDLDSTDSPIFKSGLDIVLSPYQSCNKCHNNQKSKDQLRRCSDEEGCIEYAIPGIRDRH